MKLVSNFSFVRVSLFVSAMVSALTLPQVSATAHVREVAEKAATQYLVPSAITCTVTRHTLAFVWARCWVRLVSGTEYITGIRSNKNSKKKDIILSKKREIF